MNACLKEGAMKIIDLIKKWVGKREINAIIGFDGDAIC